MHLVGRGSFSIIIYMSLFNQIILSYLSLSLGMIVLLLVTLLTDPYNY